MVNDKEDGDGDNDDIPKPSTGLLNCFGGVSHLILYFCCQWQSQTDTDLPNSKNESLHEWYQVSWSVWVAL